MKKSLGIFRFHPLLPVFLFLSWLWAGPPFISMLSALILHKSGHLMLARLMHLTVDEMKWTPFGGVIRIKNKLTQQGRYTDCVDELIAKFAII